MLRKTPLALTCLPLATMLLIGCATTPAQLAQFKADEQRAEQTYAAATQATSIAAATLATMPTTSPANAPTAKAIADAQKVEQTARLALDVAQAALDAAQKKDPTDPALTTAVTAAVSAIPSPWTPILASLIPAAIPLGVSIVQSVKLGRAHQTVQHVTAQLEQHKAALAAATATSTKS